MRLLYIISHLKSNKKRKDLLFFLLSVGPKFTPIDKTPLYWLNRWFFSISIELDYLSTIVGKLRYVWGLDFIRLDKVGFFFCSVICIIDANF